MWQWHHLNGTFDGVWVVMGGLLLVGLLLVGVLARHGMACCKLSQYGSIFCKATIHIIHNITDNPAHLPLMTSPALLLS